MMVVSTEFQIAETALLILLLSHLLLLFWHRCILSVSLDWDVGFKLLDVDLTNRKTVKVTAFAEQR